MEALGRVVVVSADIEKYLAHIFMALIDGNRGALQVVIQNVSQKTLEAWIRTLLETKKEEPLDKELLAILDEIQELRIERNSYIHGMWKFDSETGAGSVWSLKLERSDIIKETVVTLADLNEYINQAIDVSVKLMKFIEKVAPLTT